MRQFAHTLPMTVDAINLGINRRGIPSTVAISDNRHYVKDIRGNEITFIGYDEAERILSLEGKS